MMTAAAPGHYRHADAPAANDNPGFAQHKAPGEFSRLLFVMARLADEHTEQIGHHQQHEYDYAYGQPTHETIE